VGHRTGRNLLGKMQICCAYGEANCDRSVVKPRQYTDRAASIVAFFLEVKLDAVAVELFQ